MGLGVVGLGAVGWGESSDEVAVPTVEVVVVDLDDWDWVLWSVDPWVVAWDFGWLVTARRR